MTESELKALPEAQAKAVPAIDAITVSMAGGKKERRPQAKRVATFLTEGMLHRLMFLTQVPNGEGGPALVNAVRAYQRSIGVPQTGILLLREWEKLAEAAELAVPAKITLPMSQILESVPGHVLAKGTWVFENDSQASPLQTSEITCDREARTCEEKQAEIGGVLGSSHLSIFTSSYAITKWTKDEVVAENDSPLCVAYTLTISLRAKEAHLYRRGKAAKGCEQYGTKPQILTLKDGYKVAQDYYDAREAKARSLGNPEYRNAPSRYSGR